MSLPIEETKEVPLWERFYDTILDNKNSITIFTVGCGILFGLHILQNNQKLMENKVEILTERIKGMDLDLEQLGTFIKNRHMVRRLPKYIK